MAFDTYESSTHEGRPVALYQIKWGNTVWRYTSADTAQTYDGNDFLPVSIRDDGMTQGGSNENDFAVRCQVDLPIVALFADSPPTAPVWLTVRRKHEDDPDHEAPVYWVGRIANIIRTENMAEADIRGVSISKLLKSGGLRLTWSKNCPHCVYDSACRANPAAHKYERVVDTVAGSSLTITTDTIPAEGTFTGGFVEWDRDGLGTLERRGIEAQVNGTTIKVLGRLPDLAPGDPITLYPGCDQTASTCANGFDNIDNNGGFFFMPEKSPFGSQVFD